MGYTRQAESLCRTEPECSKYALEELEIVTTLAMFVTSTQKIRYPVQENGSVSTGS